MRNKVFAYLATLLLMAQIVLILVSWILTAAMPDEFSRALLSAEGIRWFLGRYVSNLSSPLLVWGMLCAVAYGAVVKSGILSYSPSVYRQRIAMRFVLAECLVLCVALLLLTIVPHAILLNVMGGIFPSSFSAALLPYGCFWLVVVSITFGVMNNQFRSIPDIFEALCWGVSYWAGLFVLYVVGMQLYSSSLYLFDY